MLTSDWSIGPQSSSLIGRLAAEKGILPDISSSHLVLNSTGSDASGGQPEAPPSDTNLQNVYWTNTNTGITDEISLQLFLLWEFSTENVFNTKVLLRPPRGLFPQMVSPLLPWWHQQVRQAGRQAGRQGGVGVILLQHLHSTGRYCR